MALKDFIANSGERNATHRKKSNEVIELEELNLSDTIRSLINFINRYGVDSELKKSAAFIIVHGAVRPQISKGKDKYAYPERFIEYDGEVYLNDINNNTYIFKKLIDPDKQKQALDWVRTYILPSFGASISDYTIIRTAEEAEQVFIDLLATGMPISMDIETSGLDPYTSDICGIGLTIYGNKGWYIPLNHKYSKKFGMNVSINTSIEEAYKQPDRSKITKIIKQYMPKLKCIGHNLKFEYKMFKVNYGIEINIYHDTQIGEFVINENLKGRYALGKCVFDKFPYIPKWKESKEFMRNIRSLPPKDVGRYCVRDVCYTYLLYLSQYAYIEKYLHRLYYEIDLPYEKVVAEAELFGFELDVDYIQELKEKLQKQAEEEAKAIYKRLGKFNIASNQELVHKLYYENDFPKIKTTKTTVSTDKGTLENLLEITGDEVFQHILNYRAYTKLLNTYTDSYVEKCNPVTGKVHPSYMLTTAVTGRISCVEPNLQNIPKTASKLVRVMFKAPEKHVLLFADYSAQEVRVLTALSKDKALMRAYNPCYECPHRKPGCEEVIDKPNYCRRQDIHSVGAKMVFSKELDGVDPQLIKGHKEYGKYRTMAKAITFGLVYGSTSAGIASRLKISVEEADEIINAYFKAFPTIKDAIDKLHQFAINNGYVKDMAGRYRHLDFLAIPPDNNNPDSPFWRKPYKVDEGYYKGIKKGFYSKFNRNLRQAQNFPMQGTSASMTKEASILFSEQAKLIIPSPKIVGFVHDEIIICCEDSLETVKKTADLIRKSMTVGLNLVEKYDFPKELPIEVTIEVGYSWGNAMSLEEYIKLKTKTHPEE